MTRLSFFCAHLALFLYDFKTDAAEQHAVANSLRPPLTPEQLCQHRGATFARLRMEAQLYSLRAAATRLLTAIAIPRTGPVWGRGLCPGSRRPRARVPLVVWAWDFSYGIFLPRSHGPCSTLFFALRSMTVCQSKRIFLSFGLGEGSWAQAQRQVRAPVQAPVSA